MKKVGLPICPVIDFLCVAKGLGRVYLVGLWQNSDSLDAVLQIVITFISKCTCHKLCFRYVKKLI